MSSEGLNKDVTNGEIKAQEDQLILANYRVEKELGHVEQKGKFMIATLERVTKWLDNKVNHKPYYGEPLTLDDPNGHVSIENIKIYVEELEKARSKFASLREDMIRLKLI